MPTQVQGKTPDQAVGDESDENQDEDGRARDQQNPPAASQRRAVAEGASVGDAVRLHKEWERPIPRRVARRLVVFAELDPQVREPTVPAVDADPVERAPGVVVLVVDRLGDVQAAVRADLVPRITLPSITDSSLTDEGSTASAEAGRFGCGRGFLVI
ncbi:hypothetical protein [Kribbella sp. NPDC050459]|uniref:hypothetical protein n=1 Tax=Kribbella sp. NPDC050459 TaxID=3155785 RepID=UPI0033E6F759